MPRSRILAAVLIAGSLAVGCWAQAGLPQTGPVIIPKKAPSTAAPAEAPPPPPTRPAAPKPQYNFSVNVPEVQIPVTVQTQEGQFVPGIGIQHFQLTEDGVLQHIDKVSVTNDAPMTVVMLIEFRNTWAPFIYNILEASYAFTGALQPQDWVALVTYDLKPTVVVDFTHDKSAIYAGLNSLHFATFSEADMFDSLSDTIDRLDGIKGHKTIVMISTGLNTFSRMTFSDLQKKLQTTQGVTIYTVSMGWSLEQWLGGNGYSQIAEMDLLQADNELRYIAKTTGGRYYQPRFEGAYNQVFQDIAGSVRSMYTLSYTPTNKKLDGTVRKIEVKLVGPDGKKLKMVNQKGKTLKYTVDYRDTYTSRHVVE
ncbi:MAG TPA: VWA domain-containing protein [Terriglobales bacterium]|nr:VWA domain-containing protein [Terriglobales bacterium]